KTERRPYQFTGRIQAHQKRDHPPRIHRQQKLPDNRVVIDELLESWWLGNHGGFRLVQGLQHVLSTSFKTATRDKCTFLSRYPHLLLSGIYYVIEVSTTGFRIIQDHTGLLCTEFPLVAGDLDHLRPLVIV